MRHYDIVLAPHITEKSTMLSETNSVVFKVAPRATKPEIKAAVEALFGVTVTRREHHRAPRARPSAGRVKPYKRSDMKKAIVRLAEGQSIDITEGARG